MSAVYFNKEKDAPLLIVFGQSNAHGHGTKLPENLIIDTPLKNVKGLSRKDNQRYNLSDVIWSEYTSYGMNLGETQDNTYCLATEFARKWQKGIDDGNELNLPDLYIVQISIGGQGIAETEKFGNMWYINRPLVMKPGNLEEVNISLYPLAVQILRLVISNLKALGKTPKILGLHWNQWETEVDTGGDSILCAEENYTKLFKGFKEALSMNFPIYLYKPLSEVYNNPVGVKHITDVFERFVDKDEDFHMVDISKSTLWNEDKSGKGIFEEDNVHYNSEAQKWFADYQFKQLFST